MPWSRAIVMVLCVIFLIAFGAGWEDWPALCFVIVSIISFEAAVIVGITVHQRCLMPLHDYDAVSTRETGGGEYYDDDGTLSDTL